MPPEITPVRSPEFAQQAPFQQTEKRSDHGLLTEALDLAFDALPGRSKSIDTTDKSGFGAADAAASFIKSVPLFMGPGRGMVLSAVLHGLDEVHRGDTTEHQLEDFALGSAKGAGTKLLMDKFGAAQELSMARKGMMIGGGSSLIDSTLTRSTWVNGTTGQLDLSGGLEKTAFNTTFGAGVGMAAFPLGHALGSKITPTAERLLGNTFDKAMIGSITTGGAFGFTSGVVGESANQLYSGSFDPLAIARRGVVEGLSTAAAGGVGHRFSNQFALNRIEAARTSGERTSGEKTSDEKTSGERTIAQADKIELPKPANQEVDNRPVGESDRARVEKEWDAVKKLSPEQLSQAKDMARQDLSEIQIEPGKSAWDVIDNAFKSGAVKDPDAVMTTIALAREHFSSLRTADGAIIPDQAANWVHTMGELARVVQYSDLVRNNAVAQRGETDPARVKEIADQAMSPEATKLAMIASAGSDSTKSQASPYMRILADGTTVADNLPANFHTHHLEGVLAIDGVREQIGLTQREFDLVKNGMLAHQVAPPETIMGLLYYFKISGAVGAIQKAAESGDTSKLAPWVQDEITADPQFPQKLADTLKRETRIMRNPAEEGKTGEIAPMAKGMPVIKAIADTGYLLMPAAEVPKGAEIPSIKPTSDGLGWELDLKPDTQMLLRLAGDSHWYVAHQPTAAERSTMTEGQIRYFDDLWKVSQAVYAGDNGQYGARESVYKYVAAMRGPGTTFHDGTVWDSINSIDTSRIDSRRILDQAGRQVVDETNGRTAQVFDRNNGSFKQRADEALIKAFDIPTENKSQAEIQAALNQIPYYGRPISEADYQNQTPDYQQAVRVRTILGDVARREAAMDPTKPTDNFQPVRSVNSRGQQ